MLNFEIGIGIVFTIALFKCTIESYISNSVSIPEKEENVCTKCPVTLYETLKGNLKKTFLVKPAAQAADTDPS